MFRRRKVSRLQAQVTEGKISINDARRKLGLKPFPEPAGLSKQYDQSVQPKWYERIIGWLVALLGW